MTWLKEIIDGPFTLTKILQHHENTTGIVNETTVVIWEKY